MMALRGTRIVRVPLIEGTGELKLMSKEEYADDLRLRGTGRWRIFTLMK